MNGRERFLSVLNRGKPDHLPCQVHNWMPYYLKHTLNGMDQWEAYEYFHMDPVIYTGPRYVFADKDLANWRQDYRVTGTDRNGHTHWINIITTPDGQLTEKGSFSEITPWKTENPIKTERDFELWNRYVPVPVGVDWTPVLEVRKRLGERGIARGALFDFGQGSPWQSFANYLYGTEAAIYLSYDNPAWLRYCLDCMLEKKLRVIDLCGEIPLDLIECGGGAGSGTVISPDLHRAFCLPYDRKQIKALHEHGTKVVYHLCGGVMPMLDLVVENGSDGLETMTPPEMGGDCDLAEANRRVGDRLFFIGGLNQYQCFENGTPEQARQMVRRLHEACPEGRYICSPSDHFFSGAPENIKAFADACRECVYFT